MCLRYVVFAFDVCDFPAFLYPVHIRENWITNAARAKTSARSRILGQGKGVHFDIGVIAVSVSVIALARRSFKKGVLSAPASAACFAVGEKVVRQMGAVRKCYELLKRLSSVELHVFLALFLTLLTFSRFLCGGFFSAADCRDDHTSEKTYDPDSSAHADQHQDYPAKTGENFCAKAKLARAGFGLRFRRGLWRGCRAVA